MDTTTAPAVDAALQASESPATETTLLQGEPAPEQQSAPEVTEKPEWLPENFWREGKADYQALAKSYTGMREILGRKSQSVLVPNEKSKPEEIAEFRKALGVPEQPDGYLEVIKPSELPEGVSFDESLAKQAAEIAHKHNIPPAAMKDFAALQMQQTQAGVQAVNAMVMQELAAGKAELQQTYGDKFADKIELAKRAAITAGIDPTSRGFMDPNMVKLALYYAERVSDDTLVGARTSPAQAGQDRATKAMTDPTDPLYARYHAHDEDAVRQVRQWMGQR